MNNQVGQNIVATKIICVICNQVFHKAATDHNHLSVSAHIA
jgi:hypothetical protein